VLALYLSVLYVVAEDPMVVQDQNLGHTAERRSAVTGIVIAAAPGEFSVAQAICDEGTVMLPARIDNHEIAQNQR